MHGLMLHNDDIRETSERLLSPGQVGLLNGWGVFSTLRVVDGVLFAYERHFARMARDAQLLHVPFPASPEFLKERLLKLVAANKAGDSTLRVAVVRNKGGMFEGPAIDREFDIIAFTKELKDWGASSRLALAPRARVADHIFAGTKMLSWSFNLVLQEAAVERGFDEVALLNERGEVSECTSANIFAVFGSKALTPPLMSGCLPGVTRALLLEEVRVRGIEIGARTLFPADLEKADEVFLTSSTRDLLPVDEIETLGIQANVERPVTRRLLQAFQQLRGEYVSARIKKQSESLASDEELAGTRR